MVSNWQMCLWSILAYLINQIHYTPWKTKSNSFGVVGVIILKVHNVGPELTDSCQDTSHYKARIKNVQCDIDVERLLSGLQAFFSHVSSGDLVHDDQGTKGWAEC